MHDKGSHQPSRKRQRESVDPEEANSRSYPFALQKQSLANFTAVKRPRLDDVYLSKNCPPISRDEHYKTWLMNVGTTRCSKNNMSQLPSPDVTTRSFSRAATASSQKSSASVQDSDYRETLEDYNNYVPGNTPPPGIKQQAEKIVFRRRETPELEDAVIDQLRKTMKDLQNKGEEEVKNKLGAHIIPGYSTPSDKRLDVVQGQLWNKAVPVPFKSSLLNPPLPLPKPKPDTTFAFSKAAFTESQLGTIKSLVQYPNGPSFASPSPDIRFPFAIIEYKSQAKDGSIRVATNQAAGAGAVALNGFLELMNRGPGLDASDVNKPLFFSVAMDQNSAYINMHWIGKTSDTNEHTFHLEELRMLPLRYDDSIQVLQRALKNIHEYAAEDLLKIIIDALDEYRDNKMKGGNTDLVEKRQAEAQLHAPPSPPKPPQSKKTRRAAPQTPAESQRSSVRTRRKIMLEDPS
ncbi:MAG: hypothetical protein MMC23_002261 [Stictis urceolatum]|nr:hypothetical protein [Stictis urceolata]